MTVIKHKDQRVAVLIDTQNIYHSAKNLYKKNVNFPKIVDDMVGDRLLVRSIAYAITTESGEEKTFLEALEKGGIETKLKDLQIFLGGAKKGDWDVGLAVDAIKLAPKVDALILIAGDGDFVPMVEYIKAKDFCQIEVVSFLKSSSAKLVEISDDFTDLSENPRKYLMGKFSKRVRIEKKTPEKISKTKISKTSKKIAPTKKKGSSDVLDRLNEEIKKIENG